MEKVWSFTKEFAVNTWKDLKHCWQIYPNIIILGSIVWFVLGVVLV